MAMMRDNEKRLVSAAVSFADSVRRFMEFLERVEKAVMKKLEEEERRKR